MGGDVTMLLGTIGIVSVMYGSSTQDCQADRQVQPKEGYARFINILKTILRCVASQRIWFR